MLQSVAFALLAPHVAGHGWLTNPVSKIELVQRARDYQNWQEGMPEEFRYCPDCSANGNNAAGHVDTPAANCGASSEVTAQGLSVWQKWYDAGGVPVPVMTPGSDFRVDVTLTADHGGEFWLMLSCATTVTQSTSWTILDRSAGHRDYAAVPSNPGIYAWPPQSSGGSATTHYHVPSSFSCPGGEGIGRWVWKTGNTCNDVNNIGRPTETFKLEELPWSGVREPCAPGQKPETFIACFDFKINGSSTPTPAPTQAPTYAPTFAPTYAPTQAPCTDDNQNCEHWANIGECEANPSWMLTNCRKSCGVCPNPTQAPTPAPQPCTDDNQGCENWAANGECDANPSWMLVNCRKSCGVCFSATASRAAYKAWGSKKTGYAAYKAWHAGMLARSGDL